MSKPNKSSVKEILAEVLQFFREIIDESSLPRLGRRKKPVYTGKYDERTDLPTPEQLEVELRHERHRRNYRQVFRSTSGVLITVAAIAILIATLWLPVLQIYGSSMTPTLSEGNVVVSLKGSRFETGDVIAFYYNNKILVKRVIANAGEWVDIDSNGNVSVNGERLNEPYLTEKAFGDCNIVLPYQVPDGKVFVMGDHRSVSVDSRNTSVGCVSEEQIVGKLAVCIWPMKDFRMLR